MCDREIKLRINKYTTQIKRATTVVTTGSPDILYAVIGHCLDY